MQRLGDEDRAAATERVAHGDGAAVRVGALEIGARLLRPRQHDGGERLVHLEDIDVVETEAGALEQRLRRRNRTGEHQHRVTPDEHRVDDARPSPHAQLRRPFLGHEQQRARAVGDLRRRAGRVHRIGFGPVGAQAGERRERRVAQALVARQRPFRELDRDDLRGEAAVGPRLGGALLRCGTELLGGEATDAERGGDAIAGVELVRDLVPLLVVRAVAGTAVGIGRRRRAERDARHHLDARRDGDVDETAADHRVTERDRFLSGPALGRDRHLPHLERQPGRQPRHAGDVAALHAYLVHAAGQHVTDRRGIDAGPFDDGLDRHSEQVTGMHARQRAVSLADGRADCLNDDDVGHDFMLPLNVSMVLRMSSDANDSVSAAQAKGATSVIAAWAWRLIARFVSCMAWGG